MNHELFLAQDNGFVLDFTSGVVPFFQDLIQQMDILTRPNDLLDALGQLPFVGAAMIVIVGLLCVFNGYRWHKWVVAVLAFLAGLGIGKILSVQMGESNVVALAIGVLCAIVATPLLRFAVAIFGGVTGAFIGANTWTAVSFGPPEAHWAGALIGFILVAMASFMIFKLVVVLFTSVGGAAMVVFGTISLLMLVPDWEPAIRSGLADNQLMIPLLVAIAAVGGFVLQQARVQEAEAAASD